MKVLYLCDPDKNENCGKHLCYRNMGRDDNINDYCSHTPEIRFARNFEDITGKSQDGVYFENFPEPPLLRSKKYLRKVEGK